MKVVHHTTYIACDGTEYTDARLCTAHEAILADGKHAYGTMGFETARDALAATLPVPAVLDRRSLMRALAVTLAMAAVDTLDLEDGALLRNLGLPSSPEELDREVEFTARVVTLCCREGWK